MFMLKIISITSKEAKEINEKAREDISYYGAIIDGSIVGIVGVRFRAWFAKEICHLFVLEKHRRQGIGTALAKKAIDIINIPLVIATVNNEISKNLFTGLGFKVVETFVNHRTGNTVSLLILNKNKQTK